MGRAPVDSAFPGILRNGLPFSEAHEEESHHGHG